MIRSDPRPFESLISIKDLRIQGFKRSSANFFLQDLSFNIVSQHFARILDPSNPVEGSNFFED